MVKVDRRYVNCMAFISKAVLRRGDVVFVNMLFVLTLWQPHIVNVLFILILWQPHIVNMLLF